MRIDFPELGDGQYVEMKDPRKLSWGKMKKMMEVASDEKAGLDAPEQIVIALVTSGYLLDEDNRPVTFPLTVESVQNVPSVVVEEVAKKFADVRGEATPKN